MVDYLEIARRALAEVNQAPMAAAPPAASQAVSPDVVKETIPNVRKAPPVAAKRDQEPRLGGSGPKWAEWKAAMLNRLFQQHGTSGQPGRITPTTVRHSGRKASESV